MQDISNVLLYFFCLPIMFNWFEQRKDKLLAEGYCIFFFVAIWTKKRLKNKYLTALNQQGWL